MSEKHIALETDQITLVEHHLIHRCTTQPRKHFDERELEELSASMKAHGFNRAWPLLVRRSSAEPGKLELVAGERRWRTAQMLGIAEVPVIVQEMSDQEMFELQLVENMRRASLTPIEEAQAFERLRTEFSYTLPQIAERVGQHEDTVAMRIKMLRAPEFMLQLLDQPEIGISVRQVVLVAGVPDKELREECAKLVIEGEWDHRLQQNVPLTVKRTKQLIRDKFMVSLKGHEKMVEDAELLPEAGPCSGCQYLAKNFLAGTGELKGHEANKGGVEPMTCCNPACFAQKKEAMYQRECAKAKAAGVAPLTSKERKATFHEDGRLRYDSEWVPVTEKPPGHITQIYDDKKIPTYEKLLETAKAAPEKKLSQLQDGQVVEMIKRDVAEALAKNLKKKGELKREKIVLTDKEKKAKEKEAYDRKVAEQVKIQTLEITRERILAKGIGIDEQRAILDVMLTHAGMDGLRLMCDWLRLAPQKPTKKGESLNQGHYRAAIMDVMGDASKPMLEALTVVAFMAKNVKQGWALDYYVKPIMLAFGFDQKAIKTAAEATVDAEMQARAAKVKNKAVKSPLKPGQKGVRKGAFDTGDSGAPVAEPGARTEPETVYDGSEPTDEANDDLPMMKVAKQARKPVGQIDPSVIDWQAEWDALPKRPGKDKPVELKAWNAERMRIKRGVAKAGVTLKAKDE